MYFKMSSSKERPLCLVLGVSTLQPRVAVTSWDPYLIHRGSTDGLAVHRTLPIQSDNPPQHKELPTQRIWSSPKWWKRESPRIKRNNGI